ncbi:hypothetical protein QBC46DRAFT_393119 [Diplogelasinospora grovesii]|uniref:Uncharacterized protein n=1 Tax=Diplogelasinospora grovesii TaxID=303347 RepID=A0AAN6S260_9PEZI|nr:hypothetical protein QBC46DRAFT_393119 [Diplogelasinospora grovesii]
MATESDHDSLFGGEGSDVDSLFGGGGDDDAELLSHFMDEVEASPNPPPVEEKQPPPPREEEAEGEPRPTLTLPTPRQPINSFQLALPSLSRTEDSSLEQSLQLLEMWNQAQPTGHEPAVVPDPLEALFMLQDGHTSGDFSVSTTTLNLEKTSQETPFPALALPLEFPKPNAELQAQLEALREASTDQEQPVNAYSSGTPQTASTGDQEDLRVPLSSIPGFRYAGSATNKNAYLPRRVDADVKDAEVLAPYVPRARKAKWCEIYERLELDQFQGKMLYNDIKQLLIATPFTVLADEKIGADVLETKAAIVKVAFHILKSEQWGEAWFGVHGKSTTPRTRFWPTDSTWILLHFSTMLHKTIYNEKERRAKRSGKKREKGAKEEASDRPSSPSPSAVSSVASASTAASTPQPTTQPATTAQGSQMLLESLVRNAANNKKRKRGDVSSPEEAFELDIPDDANLIYRVYAKDKSDGSDLSPPAVYRHTDKEIARGAFSFLKSSFEALGYAPVFEIAMPEGRRSITNESDWDMAVLTIYNRKRSGGDVIVEAFL